MCPPGGGHQHQGAGCDGCAMQEEGEEEVPGHVKQPACRDIVTWEMWVRNGKRYRSAVLRRKDVYALLGRKYAKNILDLKVDGILSL